MRSKYIYSGCLAIFIMIGIFASKSSAAAGDTPIPTFAYYYIWFNSNSWSRAKTDSPLLGNYTSDDRAVMRQHIQWAKDAGIDGFIVSWKSTDTLNRRLNQLIDVADEENFKLAIIYEGLDFDRNPLPYENIMDDLDMFIQQYAGERAFSIFSKPLVIISGTWEFSQEEISEITQSRRENLLILASERNVEGYLRIAEFVDGDAYYWSSVNPATFPGYQEKLTTMGEVIHQNGGLWIAPAAPGFDARLVGGTSVVERKDGDTFRTQINAALASSPDALGIISWNEFSENSHIEPSKNYDYQYLDIVEKINHLPFPQIAEFDSSEPIEYYPEVPVYSRAIAIGTIVLAVVSGITTIAIRRFKSYD